MTESEIRVTEKLRQYGLGDRVIVVEKQVNTARDTAKALGVDLAQIAKTVLCLADGQPLLVVVRGCDKVDTKAVAAAINATQVRVAPANAVKELTGFEINGVSPIGSIKPMRVLLDPRLDTGQPLYAAAGSNTAVFRITFDELLGLVEQNR